ncbi:hypothetical protein TNCT_295321 [Trichonephila clavata]|uniref:Uncharacterized protein n=1 Tax=Trichonephila clavata TaxID=2740835 RepID=A0A8X6GQY6_TRICU|nr:hypothetical protein TNCT_295321 [Trichonephila clavata]
MVKIRILNVQHRLNVTQLLNPFMKFVVPSDLRISLESAYENYAVIAKPLTSVLKGLEIKASNDAIILKDDQQHTFETLKKLQLPLLLFWHILNKDCQLF